MEIEHSRLPSFLGAAFSPAATPGQPERADARGLRRALFWIPTSTGLSGRSVKFQMLK